MHPTLFVMCHVSCVMCHVSHVACHVSYVMYHVSPVTCQKKIGLSGGASRWRLCYQRGLPRQVFKEALIIGVKSEQSF